jgi:hypothetical protein
VHVFMERSMRCALELRRRTQTLKISSRNEGDKDDKPDCFNAGRRRRQTRA